MISDEYVKQLFRKGDELLSKHVGPNTVLTSQFFRGTIPHISNQHPGGCKRHSFVFDKFNIIPKHCFSCYKVLIEPRTVIELFKLMVVFEKLRLPKDNCRKCMVEGRDQVPGTYKGYIYCDGIEDGNKMLKRARKVVSKKISKNIPITLKRGCSEFSLAYPEYGKIEQDQVMKYKEEWQEYENLADKELAIETHSPVNNDYNHPDYTLQDYKVMLAWLKYAAAIGDTSYIKISGRPIQ